MKYVILVGDGMGDLPLPELGNKTPLETAQIPTMDYLSRHGKLFRVKTIPDGYPPGSDVANLSLLGYRPQDFYSGRAPLEAASMGVELAAEEIACRCNLVTLEHVSDSAVLMVDYSADHISTPEAEVLIEFLNRNFSNDVLRFYPGVSYRHLMVYKGSLNGLETVPPHDYTGQDVSRFWRQYHGFPRLKKLLAKALPLLQKHEVNRRRTQDGRNPANAIWLWGQGKAPVMPTISQLHGIDGALISAVDLLKGIGVYGGLDIINVPGATGYLDTNYEGKATAALSALEKKDFVFVHVEAPDEVGHQGLVREKIRAIEDFDRRIVKPVFEGLSQLDGKPDFRLVIAMDHYTPISMRTHATFPVPVILYDSRKADQGSGLDFTERNAEAGNCILDDGEMFFNRLLEKK